MGQRSIDSCLKKPVIPVVWDPGSHEALLSRASSVFLQGGRLRDLGSIVQRFRADVLSHLPLFVHVDLVAGLENSDAGIEHLASYEHITGIVTVHHHLAVAARRLGLLTIVRLFLSDSRAVDRGVAVVKKSRADAVEILPACVASKVTKDFAPYAIPRIAGGLCRTERDVNDVLESGCRAVTSTSPTLWKLNCI